VTSVMSHDLKFKHPFLSIIAGPSASGKSSFCIKLLQNHESLCTEPRFAGGFLWCYGEKNAVLLRQSVSGKRIEFHEGVPENFENAGGKPPLNILEDLLTEVYSEKVCLLFTKGCHHRNISVILITQNLFHQGPYCRDISLNTKYLVFLKNVRNKRQFSHLARQVYPQDSVSLYKAYLDAAEKAHGYLLLDLAQGTNERLWFRAHIFPNEKPHIIYTPASDDTSTKTIQLSHSTSA
jgi:hypothetical protein